MDKNVIKITSNGSTKGAASKQNEEPKKKKTPRQSKKQLFEKVEHHLLENYDFRLNEISNAIEFRKKGESFYLELNENTIYRDLAHNSISFSLSDVRALFGSDFVPVYNPFKEYFNQLPKYNADNPIDYIEQLANYVTAKNQKRFNRHFKKMLVRSVACALVDKVFNKQAFILVDASDSKKSTDQSMGKTTYCRFLCPQELSEYLAENPSTDKDGLIALSENFIINLDELAMLNRAEINQLKSFMSKDRIKARLPFARRATTLPRRANFVGSTNKPEFLTDETGSVRWLCLEIYDIDWNYMKEVDINLVWSQAYALFQAGFDYTLTADEINENEIENKKHQVITAEFDLVQKYFVPSAKSDPEAVFYTATDILIYLSEQTKSRIKLSNVNIGKALKMLRFEQSQKFISEQNQQIKGYYVRHVSQIQDNADSTEKVPF